MSHTKMVASATVVVASVLGLGLVGTGSATAATGSWRAYGSTNPITSSTSTWSCGGTKEVGNRVLAQVCAIRTPDGRYAQSAVIVRNNNSSRVGMTAQSDLSTVNGFVNRWSCTQSAVAPNSWSVCFGATGDYWADYVIARGDANLASLPISPWA